MFIVETEGSFRNGSLNLSLTKAPEHYPVTVFLSTRFSKVNIAPRSFTFTNKTWDIRVPINVWPDDDHLFRGTVRHDLIWTRLVSRDPLYQRDFMAAIGQDDYEQVNVTIIEDDFVELVFYSNYVQLPTWLSNALKNDNHTKDVDYDSTVVIDEGSSVATFRLSLGSQPRSEVQVTPNPSGDLTFIPTNVTFTPDNWADHVLVEMHHKDNDVYQHHHYELIVFNVTAVNDSYYEALRPLPLAVGIIDDDEPGITVSITDGRAHNNDNDDIVGLHPNVTQATLKVALTGAPTDHVNMTLSGYENISLGVTALSFDAYNWYTPQVVKVNVTDTTMGRLLASTDTYVATTIEIYANSHDEHYHGITEYLDVVISTTESTLAPPEVTKLR